MPSALTAYVKARAADADKRVDLAAAAYGAVLTASPDNAAVAVRAYREALAAGDLDLARRAAVTMTAAKVAPIDTGLLRIADLVRARDWTGAEAGATALTGTPLDFLTPSIRAWIAYERGDADPTAVLAADAPNALARRVNGETRALILIASGRTDAAIVALQGILGTSPGSFDLRLSAAQLLAGRGRGRDAAALLTGDDPALAAARSALGRGVKGSAAFGIARLYDRLAGDIVEGDARPLAIVLTRSALLLDPSDDRARLILADALSRDGLPERALAVLADIDRRGVAAAAAQSLRISVLNRAGDTAGAIAAAQALSEVRGADATAAQRVADLLMAEERYDEAAAAYATAIARSGQAAGWVLYLQRGGALDEAGRWAEAKPMLERAVALAPQEAIALNYLGYAMIEHGEDPATARALLERAQKLQPGDSAIADSLGWAYVRSGMLARGVPLLETAARAEPADTTIQEHLGDAYWQAGRRYEARYAWRAAALYAEGDDAARIAGKIAGTTTAAR